MTTPILIWGAGAIGGTLGASFIRAGHEVIFVDNAADHVAAINAKGLRIDGPIYQDIVTYGGKFPDNLFTGTPETIQALKDAIRRQQGR